MRDLLDRIGRELGGEKQADGSYNCLCPCHNDKNPSLHVALKDGKILLHCFAGCENQDIIDILKARGLWIEQSTYSQPSPHRTKPVQQATIKKPSLPPTLPKGITRERKGKILTQIWPYRDREGKLSGYVARYDSQDSSKKNIVPYFRRKGESWVQGAPPVPRPLYGINLLAKAPKDLTIWIVEGEKCAEAMQRTHRLAITSLGGSNSARFADWSPLAGRKIRIWPDNDGPGKKYADEVKIQLEGLMPPLVSIERVDSGHIGLAEKEDAFDWLQTHDPKELDTLPLIKKRQVVAVTLPELLAMEFKPEELILDPWLPTQGLCMIHSKPGVGKTFLAVGIAFAVAAGTKFLKWEAAKPRNVLYIDGEMAGNDIKKRFEKLVVEHGYNVPEKTLKIVSPDLNNDRIPDIGTLEGQKLIEEKITKECELVILDNLSCLQRSGDENKARGWTCMQEWLLHLKSMGKAILLIHHSGKGGAQRGTSRREDALNTILTLKRNPLYEFEEGACFEIHYEKARSVYGPAARPFEAKYDNVEGLWTVRDLKTVTYDQVVELMKAGTKQVEIAQLLGKTRSLVSQYVKKAKEEGRL